MVNRETAVWQKRPNVREKEGFSPILKKGDFFYLCRADKVRFLGRIISDEIKEYEGGREDWYALKYEKVANSLDRKPYLGEKHWWTPNGKSIYACVPKEEWAIFETIILKPYFHLNLPALVEKRYRHNHWLLRFSRVGRNDGIIPIGGRYKYSFYDAEGQRRQKFINALSVRKGDKIIGFVSEPVEQIRAIFNVIAVEEGENFVCEKYESLVVPIDLAVFCKHISLVDMEYFQRGGGDLFHLTEQEYSCIKEEIRAYNPRRNGQAVKPYLKRDFLREVYIEESQYKNLVAVLHRKKNIILQGPPGVGKTFMAKRLAYTLLGERAERQIECVQFHQNYSYEDFVMGYRAVENGFALRYGIFYQFCQRASSNPQKDYFFLIDEINRGNVSKIFGELLALIETDYRGKEVTLAYNGQRFFVPQNLYIIGMMNTADRSLALLDYALRRRFSFFDIEPAFQTKSFCAYQERVADEKFDKLLVEIQNLNAEIRADKLLGNGFCIGHSYFCNARQCTEQWLHDIIKFDILPLLHEYWFDEPEKCEYWEQVLLGAIQ